MSICASPATRRTHAGTFTGFCCQPSCCAHGILPFLALLQHLRGSPREHHFVCAGASSPEYCTDCCRLPAARRRSCALRHHLCSVLAIIHLMRFIWQAAFHYLFHRRGSTALSNDPLPVTRFYATALWYRTSSIHVLSNRKCHNKTQNLSASI